jgi:hypothetical protein
MNIFEIFENKRRVGRTASKTNEGIGPDRNDPWEQGWRAGFRQNEFNPYPAGSKKARQWDDGYAEARAQPDHYDEGVAEGKITLSTDPNWYGAEVGDYKATGPVVNISANKLVGFEPDDKMTQPKSKANVEKILAGLKQGDKLPPLLVRKYKNGYQVLDGHHRFWAYKLLGTKSIPVQVVPDSDIEEKGQQNVTEDSFNDTSGTFMDRLVGEIMNYQSLNNVNPKLNDFSSAVKSKLKSLGEIKAKQIYQQALKQSAELSGQQGMAEDLNEAIGGNYLYHATGGLKNILASSQINATGSPQDVTKAQTKFPTVSTTRDWNYAIGGKGVTTPGVERAAIIVLDRNAVESNFKTLGTSQSREQRGLSSPRSDDLSAGKTARDLDANKDNTLNKKDADEWWAQHQAGKDIFGQGFVPRFSKLGDLRTNIDQKIAQAVDQFQAPKRGGEFEEAVVVPKGGLPIKGTMVGFYIPPSSPLMKDPEIVNDPRRLDLAPGGTGRFVKATQQQGVAEVRAGVDDTDTVGFSVNSEAAYTAVMKRFGGVIDHDETSGIMYAPARIWPQIEMVAFDADGEGATRDDGIDESGVAEARSNSAVASAIVNRIVNQRSDLMKYGPDRVMSAVGEVADWIGDVDEIGSSDVSAWVNQVARYLQTQAGEGIAEDDVNENLRDWFGKEKWVRMDTKGNIKGDCARGSEKEGKPKCLPQAKAHALGKKGRAAAAQKKRREDPNPERRGAAINVDTKVREQDDLDEACWKGYHKEGMKTMFGKKYPNCVKNKNESLETYIKRNECPGCGGLMVSESQLTEKKDACYHKVKSRYKVWPSAYASGALVRCRKVGADSWGNKSESATEATNPAQQAAIAISKKKKAELTEEAKAQVIDAVADFYKNQLAQSEPGEVSDYKAQAKKLLAKADEKQRSKVLDMLQAGLKNPYLQGAIITIVGSLVSGAVIKHFSSMGLSPQQFNMVLQGAMNSVIPTLAAKLHGMGWSDAIKTGLASVGVGVGAAGVLEAERNEMDTPAVQAALKNMAARHNKEQWSTEQLAALGKRLAAAAQDKKSAKSAEESGMEEDQWSDGSDQWSDGKGQWSDGRGQWSESIDADIADYLTEMKNAGYDIK